MIPELLQPPAEVCVSPSETERRVLELVAELANPESALSQAFYGPLGIEPTPLVDARRPMAGHTALLKNETAHSLRVDETLESGSFKRRGALLAALVACRGEEQPDTFVTASQGNHAIAVAMAAVSLGRQAAIFCPKSLNPVKRQKLEDLNAKVYTYGLETFEDALNAAVLAAEDPASYLIHPFNQTEVIAGQATVGLEIVRDLERQASVGKIDLHSTPVEVNVAVGGGGFIAGVAIVLKYFKDIGVIGDNVRLVGAQMEGCDAARRSVEDLRLGGKGVAYFSEGEYNPACDSTAVTAIGNLVLPFLASHDYVHSFRVVPPATLGRYMRTLAGIFHKLIEPAGSLAYASACMSALDNPQPFTRDECPTVYISPVCGSNTTMEKYREFQGYDRAEYDARMARLAQMHRLGLAAMSAGSLKSDRAPGGSTKVWSSPVAGLRCGSR